MGTILIFLELFFALILLVGNVNANGTVKETMITTNNTEIKSSLELFATETATEETLELEKCMTNNNVWDLEINENIESALALENWMVNENVWHKGESVSVETVSEEALELENWMTNHKVWHTNHKISFDLETEESIIIEDWMTSENIWNK